MDSFSIHVRLTVIVCGKWLWKGSTTEHWLAGLRSNKRTVFPACNSESGETGRVLIHSVAFLAINCTDLMIHPGSCFSSSLVSSLGALSTADWKTLWASDVVCRVGAIILAVNDKFLRPIGSSGSCAAVWAAIPDLFWENTRSRVIRSILDVWWGVA
jgi:hypothetical protein